jgi:hypothetical protein
MTSGATTEFPGEVSPGARGGPPRRGRKEGLQSVVLGQHGVLVPQARRLTHQGA